MTFTAVVVSHANEPGLLHMLGNLRYQTRPPDQTVVMCSETPALARLVEDFPDVQFHACADMGDWGHAKRAGGIVHAAGEWIGWFNDDDTYASDYLEKMLAKAAEDVDVVFCEWNENPGCAFRSYQSTAGNFIVRTEMAWRIGYPTGRVYDLDGVFIDRLVAAGARIVKVDELLYRHNAFEVAA